MEWKEKPKQIDFLSCFIGPSVTQRHYTHACILNMGRQAIINSSSRNFIWVCPNTIFRLMRIKCWYLVCLKWALRCVYLFRAIWCNSKNINVLYCQSKLMKVLFFMEMILINAAMRCVMNFYKVLKTKRGTLRLSQSFWWNHINWHNHLIYH